MKGRKQRQLVQPQPREQSKEASPGSLPEFPSGRCCYRSRSNFQRGRVGPGEECLFAVHTSNLWRTGDRGAQRQEAFSANHYELGIPSLSLALRSPTACHWLGMFGPAPRGSPKPHCQEQEGCETRHHIQAKEHLGQWRGARKLEIGKVYKIIECTSPANDHPTPSLLGHLQREEWQWLFPGWVLSWGHYTWVLSPKPQPLESLLWTSPLPVPRQTFSWVGSYLEPLDGSSLSAILGLLNLLPGPLHPGHPAHQQWGALCLEVA